MNNLPAVVQGKVSEISSLVEKLDFSFPNGSNYSRYGFPASKRGTHEEPGLWVRIREKEFTIHFDSLGYRFEVHQGLGPGADFGKYFNTRSATSFEIVLESQYKI